MKVDVVIPRHNEKAIIGMAKKLGYDALILLYPFEKLKQLKQVAHPEVKLLYGCLISKQKPKGVKFTAAPNPNRHTFEKLKPNIVYQLELTKNKDKTHYRLSGLDDVSCKLAAENDIAIGFSFSSLLDSKLPRAVLLGRMAQNIRFCKKFKLKMVLASFACQPYDMRSPHDLKALGISLGMTPIEAKMSIESLSACFE